MRLFFFTLLLISGPVMAQDVESALSITQKECMKLIRMNTVNGADYVPGVDAHGNKVVGADVHEDSKLDLPEEITFDLGIDLAEKYNFGPGFQGKAKLGEVKIKGRDVYWNGKKLYKDENQAVLDACLAQYGQKE
ncbi:hypothetical protein GCM10011332_01730 [Terasakiella brassicae]|uniref:Uncharacterized protein n=1 Tax=Terasakiella brassicae TaxID=1634917 RepID=A0A917BPQ5_9PROT|nr:hypothetical protein [Terasakiella brassicae]GGF52098.1 hypothetical protein GCM10011332_01730 [Terasakiella brassicae]